VQPDTWFSRYAAKDRLQLASLPLQVSAVMRSWQVLNPSFGSKSSAAWQYLLNSVV